MLHHLRAVVLDEVDRLLRLGKRLESGLAGLRRHDAGDLGQPPGEALLARAQQPHALLVRHGPPAAGRRPRRRHRGVHHALVAVSSGRDHRARVARIVAGEDVARLVLTTPDHVRQHARSTGSRLGQCHLEPLVECTIAEVRRGVTQLGSHDWIRS